MYTEEYIKELVEEKAQVFKSTKKGANVSFGPVYDLSVKYKHRILVHSDTDYFPENLYRDRAPNQTDDELKYVKNNHKAITYPVFDRYQTAMSRIWNDANWSVNSWGTVGSKFPEEEAPQKYFESKYPVFGSLEYYYKNIVSEVKSKDANALLVHKPYEIPIKTDANGDIIFGEDGRVQVDQSQMIDPIAFIFDCENVIDFREGKYALVLTQERCIVKNGDKDERSGFVFEFYDEENIYSVRQIGNKSDYTFSVSLLWQHNLGYLPCQKLKGKPSFVQDRVIYKSHFMPACEPLDIAILDNSYLLIAKYRHAFPQKWEYITPCEHTDSNGTCEKGFIRTGPDTTITCPSCKGTGVQRSASPFHTIQVPLPDSLISSAQLPASPFAGYITPEITTPEFLDKQIDKNIARALSILNIDSSNEAVKGGDTALGKQIDREDMFAFLLNGSDQMFDLFEFSMKTIQKMRYGIDAEEPKVSRPKNFSIRTEADLTEEISEAKSEGLPDVVIRQLIFEYTNTRFSNSDRASQIIDLVFATDRLVTLSTLEISQKMAIGTVAKWEDILHTSIYMWIDDFVKTDPGFFDNDFQKQQEIIIAKAKEKELEISPNKINTDQILSSANA